MRKHTSCMLHLLNCIISFIHADSLAVFVLQTIRLPETVPVIPPDPDHTCYVSKAYVSVQRQATTTSGPRHPFVTC